MEIERRIELPGNRAAAAARAMFPQSRHPVRHGWLGGRVVVGEDTLFLAVGGRVPAAFWWTPLLSGSARLGGPRPVPLRVSRLWA